MISKHIDLIAVAFLLAAIALFSGARHMVVLTMSGPAHYFRMNEGRQVRVAPLPVMPPMPQMPAVPSIPLQRD